MATTPIRRGRDFTRPELESRWQRIVRSPVLWIGVVAVLVGTVVALVMVAAQRFA